MFVLYLFCFVLKLKCEVFTDRDIFYAIFDCREVNGRINQYIVVSNEMFVFGDRKRTFWSENRFIDYYDRTKQIIFPYDEKTKHLFAIEKWKCVN